MSTFGMPGPGGSLGCCALCGDSFMEEVLLGKNVKTFKQAGSNTTFCAHDRCLEQFDKPGLTMLDLPEASPLRKAYEKQQRDAENAPAQGREE